MSELSLYKMAARVASIPTHSHNVRIGGTIEFVKDSGPVRRDLRVQGFKWSSDSLRSLAKILWAAQRSHSYAMASLRLFSKMPSSEFSPDGLLGGRGYIQSIKDLRTALGQATEILSSFTDTLHDEINAEHWSQTSDPEADGIIEDVEQVKADPEAFVQQEFSEEEHEEFENPSAEGMNPSAESSDDDSEDSEEPADASGPRLSTKVKPKVKKKSAPGSMLPTKDPAEQKYGKTMDEAYMHTTRPDHGSYASVAARIADSSLPVETLSGPRVDHIGPAEGNEAGHFTDEAVWPSDDTIGDGVSSGVNESKYLYEGPDASGDGVTGYSNPTDGDDTVLKVANYSWLPGSDNSKNLNYYELGLSSDDIAWMRANNSPDLPKSMVQKPKKKSSNWLWDSKVIR